MNQRLQRKLGLFDSSFLGLGAIIGAGVFVVTGVASQTAGPAMLVGFLIAGIAALCNALSVAQLARIYPMSGGTYVYAGHCLHPAAGFIAGWMFLISKLAAASVVALSFAHYVQAVIPPIPIRSTAVALVLLLTLLNFLGVKKTSLFNVIVVLFTVTVLVVFSLVGMSKASVTNFIPFAPFGLRGVLQAAALLFFAYTGYARIATLGEEVENPQVTIPKAILIALGGSALMYLLVSSAMLGTTPAAQLATGSPLETAAQQWAMPWLEVLIAMAAISAMVSVHLGQLLGISRMFFAMARNKDLPGVLSGIWVKRDIPHMALLLTAGSVILLVIVADFISIISMASFAILVYYGLANVSALTLAQAQRLYPTWVSWLGLAVCTVLAASLTPNTIVTGTVALLAGLLYFYTVARRNWASECG